MRKGITITFLAENFHSKRILLIWKCRSIFKKRACGQKRPNFKKPSKVLNKFLNIPKFCIKYSMTMVLHTPVCMQTVWNVNPVHGGILHLPFSEKLPIFFLLKPHGLLHLPLTFCPWPSYNFCFPCWNLFWDQTESSLQHGHLKNQLYC